MKLPSLNLDQAAIFFDFDGTLVDLQQTPDMVVVNSRLKLMLTQLNIQTNQSIAIISGRSIASLDQLLDLSQITLSGSHGMQYRYANQTQILHHPDVIPIQESIYKEAKLFCETHNLLWEVKPLSIAIHYRNRPELENVIEKFLHKFIKQNNKFEIQGGKYIRELKPRGISKASALELFMQHPPFKSLTPWYLGDDITDEDAFNWVNQHQGISIKIGEGKTQAKYHIDTPDDVLKFFQTNLIKEES
ncbi:trehalose-phosphatase [Celerinatantimonas sp. YJH-8]|uniref:trehalose-phosphatase n=1 Tax=Celerinatantimonas sp. YJH-8 TaxID=3228714 RepID=UPI0038C6CD41